MAKPKLALIPASQGTKLYSVLPADGVGDFNFSRNSAATRINKDGLIETVASGVSRLNYPLIDGVVNGCPHHILEPSRLQKIQYSEAFDNAYWTKSGSSVVSGFTSPKGDLSAFKLVESSTNAFHGFYQNASVSLSIGKITMSIFVKANGRDYFQLRTGSAAGITGAPLYANFDLTNDSVSASSSGVDNAKIEPFTNNWKKISISFTVTSGSQASLVFQPITTNSAAIGETYQGDGTSGVYIFGAQIEQGSFPTSYIPNYGTSAGITRVAETANGAGDASTFSDSEGVLMAEISALSNGGNLMTVSLNDGDGTADNHVSILYRNNSSEIWAQASGGGTSTNIFLYDVQQDYNNKIAIAYASNSLKIYINGILKGNTTLNALPNGLSSIDFKSGGNTENFYGSAKQIQYFDSALNDSDLEKITSWTSFTDLANGQTYSIK